MNRKLFVKIVVVIRELEFDSYFVCKQDYVGTIGFSSIRKCIDALRMLSYEALGNTQDDYMRMAESPSPLQLSACIGSTQEWWQCLDHFT
jgi:hypothetical protein